MHRSNAREQDVVGRYGGEEFPVLLPGLILEQAAAVAERIRLATQSSGSDNGHVPHVTASFGVTAATANEDTATLLARADAALYAAKSRGRNRVEVAQ